jgi:hypothetical protein
MSERAADGGRAFFGGEGGHFDLEVDAVELGIGDFGEVAGDLVLGADACAAAVVVEAAGALLRCLFVICHFWCITIENRLAHIRYRPRRANSSFSRYPQRAGSLVVDTSVRRPTFAMAATYLP